MAAGRSFFNEALSLRLIPLPTKEKTRIAVIVSKKVAQTAVARNRIRRRIYAACHPLLPHLRDGYLCLIYPRREAGALSAHTLASAIQKLCQSAGLL